MNLQKKIIIGGAQFGMKYGVANKHGEISMKSSRKDITFCNKKKNLQ